MQFVTSNRELVAVIFAKPGQLHKGASEVDIAI